MQKRRHRYEHTRPLPATRGDGEYLIWGRAVYGSMQTRKHKYEHTRPLPATAGEGDLCVDHFGAESQLNCDVLEPGFGVFFPEKNNGNITKSCRR